MVCLTGVDGCGKSTQMEYLTTWLTEVGIGYEYIRFQDVIVPQNKIIKSAIKYIKENQLETNDSIFESVYLGYKTRYLMEEILTPLLSTKKIVFVERYVESGFLYLKNRNINNIYYKDIRPARKFLINNYAGEIKEGYAADFVIIDYKAGVNASNIFEWLINDTPKIKDLIVNGQSLNN